MEQINSVEELFAPLGAYLTSIETDDYLVYTDQHPSLPLYERNDYTIIIKRIALRIYRFKPQEALPIINSYLNRVTKVIPKLQPIKYELEESEVGFKKVEMSEKDGICIMNCFKSELFEFEKHLKIFQENFTSQLELSSGIKPIESSNNIVIELPQNFTVTELGAYFKPLINLEQAALFLFYLKGNGLLPPYSDRSIGVLAESFLGRNRKGITTNLTDIYSLKHDSKNLQVLKNILESILSEIDSDLKKAR